MSWPLSPIVKIKPLNIKTLKHKSRKNESYNEYENENKIQTYK